MDASLKRKAAPAARKPKKSKKVNDGLKKPTSPYIYFVSDYRLLLKKKGVATTRLQEVAKLCGAAWNGMTEEEKAPYYEKSNVDKQRYSKEKEVLDKQQGKDPNKPKRAQTAYFFFLADFRKEMQGKTLSDGAKIPTLAGERWRSMTEEDKKKYNDMVIKDKERYEKAMEEYRAEHPESPKKVAPKKKVIEEAPVASSDDEDESEDETDDEDSDDDDSD